MSSSFANSTTRTPPVRVSSPPLRTLSPVEVYPQASRANATRQLPQVKRVRVVRLPTDAEGAKNQKYAVDLYFCKEGCHVPALIKDKQMSSAPKHQKDLRPIEDCTPDHQLVWTVAQFCSLRNAVHSCVETDHLGSRCGFCGQLNRYMTFGGGHAMFFVNLAFDISIDASQSLTDFMNHTITLCQFEQFEAGKNHECKAHRRLRSLIRAFAFSSPGQP